VNLGRNEVLISFVLFGLAHVPDWHMVEITARAGLAILGDQDLCTYCICRGDRKGDVVPGSNIRCEKTGNQKPSLIGEHTATWAFLPLNAHYALRADGHG